MRLREPPGKYQEFMHQETVVDWFRVLIDLKQADLSMYDVSHLIAVPKATLIAWKNDGTEPRYEAGSKLVALWCKIQNQPIEEIPRRPRTFSAASSKRLAPTTR